MNRESRAPANCVGRLRGAAREYFVSVGPNERDAAITLAEFEVADKGGS